MSVPGHSDDSSGNILLPGDQTVPDITQSGSSSVTPDPYETQQDPDAAQRPHQDRSITNSPNSAGLNQNITNDPKVSRLNSQSQQADNGDTMDDPLALGHRASAEPLASEDTQQDPLGAAKKVWPDPLAAADTVQEGPGSGRKIYPDPLAPDATQQEFGASKPTAGDGGGAPSSESTNWDPVNGAGPTPPVSTNSKQATRKAGSGHGFSEGDLFARKYEIKGHVGQGGMGVVYKALDLILGRIVAIKFLKAKSGIKPEEMSRFQQEAKAIASLNHVNIIRVHDMSVTDDGDPFFVLEYLEGHALSSEIRGKKQLPLGRALDIISQVCDALQHAHERGVIHRDIKPSNLMVVPQPNGTDTIKLLDFGIAKLNPIDEQTLLKLTKTGELFGSPHYMSPEQCAGKGINETTDIYSLGCVLYEMICGVPPYSGASAFETLDKHKNAALPSVSNTRNDLPQSEQIDSLIENMMAKEPSDRYQTPSEVKAAIQEISRPPEVEGVSLAPEKGGTFSSGVKDSQNRKTAGLAFLCAIGLLGLCVVPMLLNIAKDRPPSTVLPAKKLKSWKTYDQQGQQLFDMGSYRSAEEHFKLAVEKAKSEAGEKKELHLYTSLQELRILYNAIGDKKGEDWATGELVECVEYTIGTPSKYSWDDISEKVKRATTAGDLDSAVEMARELVVNVGSAASKKQDARAMLQHLENQVEEIGNFGIAADQFRLLKTYVDAKDARPAPSTASDEVKRLLALNPEKLSPEMSSVLVSVGLKQLDPSNLNVLEKFAEYSTQHCQLQRHRTAAQLLLFDIFFAMGRESAASEAIKTALREAESQDPRNYWLMLTALSKRGELFVENKSFAAAIPLYNRALSISECIPSLGERRGGGTADVIKVELAVAYAGMGRYDRAEKTLVALIETPGRAIDSRRACWLRQLGDIYAQQDKLDKAEKTLAESVTTFAKQKSLSRYHATQYKAAIADLARITDKRKIESSSNVIHGGHAIKKPD